MLEKMKQEIERKYALNQIPENLRIEKAEIIEQGFIYRDFSTIIRVRKITPVYPQKEEPYYIYTVKTKGDINYTGDYTLGQKYEIENEISREEYEKVIPHRISQKIIKTRIVVPIENQLKVEIDLYDDYLTGLLTAEVEFPDQEAAKHFHQPEWLGEELGYKELSNRKLAEMTKEEWQSKVGPKRIKQNENLIVKLKEKIKQNGNQ